MATRFLSLDLKKKITKPVSNLNPKLVITIMTMRLQNRPLLQLRL